jgi:hypothetical protein
VDDEHIVWVRGKYSEPRYVQFADNDYNNTDPSLHGSHGRIALDFHQ